ncbi:hypothetical protein M1N05_02265 [Dehalococcoidales bacterium]|nr:hypothetical protein [Dehalococcoidales bacterium]MCL0091480.1 hypothetical protein [Dehalococcoidales bacterium]
MLAFEILIDRWQLALFVTFAFLIGAMAGLVFLAINKDKALKFGVKLDQHRKPVIKPLFEIVKKPRGALKAVLFIFVVNLLGGAGLWATASGLLIIPPFLWLAMIGLLVVLVVARYPERLPIAVPVVPFEVGAFIIAATGGVNIGINLFFGGDVGLAIREWITLFYTLIIPLQFIAAFFEGILVHRVYIVQQKPLPEWLSED